MVQIALVVRRRASVLGFAGENSPVDCHKFLTPWQKTHIPISHQFNCNLLICDYI